MYTQIKNDKWFNAAGLRATPANALFKTGNVEFKAAWAIVDDGYQIPGAYTRKAMVPKVANLKVNGVTTIGVPAENPEFEEVDVALIGYEPGPDGDGAKLLYRLMHHYTGPGLTYAHHWKKGDLVIYDNRSLIHSATWYDAAKHERVMWRTTVHGNPGPLYDGEEKSWVPRPETQA